MLRMLCVSQCFQQVAIATYPTAVLWGTGALACQTTGCYPERVLAHFILCQMLNPFNGNLVHPAVSQVILVRQRQPLGPDRCIQLGTPTIPDAAVRTCPLRVGDTIRDGLLIDAQSK